MMSDAAHADATSLPSGDGEDSTPRPGLASWLTWACDLGAAAVIAVVAVIAIVTFRDYGITWDETWHMVYGDFILDWFLSKGADSSALSYRVDYLYGGGFDLLGAVVRRYAAVALTDWELIHLCGAMVGIVGLIGTWRLARQLGGPVAGLAATLMLATTPVWHGHMFNNPKDMPFAVGYVWAIAALCRVATALPRVSRRHWIVLSVTAGLAMSVRIGGLLVLCYLVALIGAFAWLRLRQTRRLDPALQVLVGLGRPVLRVILGAWVVMLVSWPWALLDPLRRPLLALARMSRFTIHERRMPFAGGQMLTTEPRPDYLLHYFGLKIPVLVLVLAAVGVALALWGWRRLGTQAVLVSARGRALAVLALAIVFPPVYAIVGRSVLYDGLRHFLFLVPLLCVVAAVAAVSLPRLVGGRKAVTSFIVAVGIVGGTARVAADMRHLHPHEYVYFNRFAGGLPGAFLNYDTDYYGNSYKEAFEILADQLWEEDPDAYLETSYVLSGCIPDFIAARYLPGGFRWKDREKWRRKPWMKKARPDFYIGYTRANCHNRHKNDPVYMEVQRFETLLNVIRDRRLEPSDGDDTAKGDRRKRRRSRRRGANWDKPVTPRPAPGAQTKEVGGE